MICQVVILILLLQQSSATLNDAVILEFDFVPTSSQVKFNYLFASEEYTGTFLVVSQMHLLYY
jgi:hypothetical protein